MISKLSIQDSRLKSPARAQAKIGIHFFALDRHLRCTNRADKSRERVATISFRISLKYEQKSSRERSDERGAAQSAHSGRRLRNFGAHDRQMPCASGGEHRGIPFRLSARQHALRLQRREGRRFQSSNRKRSDRPGDSGMAQPQRRTENGGGNQTLERRSRRDASLR